MIKRINSVAELHTALSDMESGERLKKICSAQKHVDGDWDLTHLKSSLCEMFATNESLCLAVAYYRDGKANSLFFGLISPSTASGKLGLHEIIWVTSGKSSLDGIKVMQEVEKFIQEKKISYLQASYMCNGGDPRVQLFYLNNGFRLDTLSFVKNYE